MSVTPKLVTAQSASPVTISSQQVKSQEDEAKALTNTALNYHNQKNYEKAIEVYKQALVICQKLKNRPAEANTLFQIGFNYNKQQQYKQSIETASTIDSSTS